MHAYMHAFHITACHVMPYHFMSLSCSFQFISVHFSHCLALCCIALRRITLLYTTLHYIALHDFALHYTYIPYHITPYHTISYYIIPHHICRYRHIMPVHVCVCVCGSQAGMNMHAGALHKFMRSRIALSIGLCQLRSAEDRFQLGPLFRKNMMFRVFDLAFLPMNLMWDLTYRKSKNHRT